MHDAGLPLLLATALLLGLRHGIDWDHIAAVADITAAQERLRGGFFLGSFYAAGHASIIFALGLLAVLLGAQVPDAVDSVMEPAVGVTLIVLGAYVVAALWRHGLDFRLRSRWLLLIDGLHALGHRVAASLTRKAAAPRHRAIATYGPRTAFGVGVLHGIGAETPTQAVLLTTAAGIGGGMLGVGLLGVFVTGMLASTLLIVAVSLAGYLGTARNPRISAGLSLATAAFSIGVGVTFLAGRSGALPALLGG